MTSSSSAAAAYRLGQSAGKAGLVEKDKSAILSRVYELSKDSKFYANEEKKAAKTEERVRLLFDKYQLLLKQQQQQQLSMEQRVVDARLKVLEDSRDLSRTLVHVDMDAFYASVEIRDHPELQGKPVAVGGMSMLSTANYEARKFGVRSAMPGFIAKELCPSLIIVPCHFDRYREASKLAQDLFALYDANFDMMSLDEAYLDLTEYLHLHPEQSRDQVVQDIRAKIFEKTQLTASAGIGANRLLSKVCSDMNKPNGQYSLPNERESIMDFVGALPIRKISGVGKVTERILAGINVHTCADLRAQLVYIYALFSITMFDFLARAALGISSTSTGVEWNRKSMSVERTFSAMSSPDQMRSKLRELSVLLESDLKTENLAGKTVSIKLKTTAFEIKTKSKSVSKLVCSKEDLYSIALPLLEEEFPISLRLMGLRLSSFQSEEEQKQPSMMSFLAKAKNSSTDDNQVICLDLTESDSDEFDAIAEDDDYVNESQRSTPEVLDLTGDDDVVEEEKTKAEIHFTCPVCKKIDKESLKRQDILTFNAHIEECLNATTKKFLPLSGSSHDKKMTKAGTATKKIEQRKPTLKEPNYGSAAIMMKFLARGNM